METQSDIHLWKQIKENDTKAFMTLYNRYWERAYTISYWHVYDQDAAKDIVQDLFIYLWEKRHHIEIRENVEAYLKMATRNRVLNYIRSRNTRKKHTDKSVAEEPESSRSAAVGNERELTKLYREEIDKLPARMKEIYVLSKEQGQTTVEIATRLSLSEQTVKNQITSAMKKIRSALEYYRLISFLGFWISYMILIS